MAQQERLITTQGERRKKKEKGGQLRKERSLRQRERERNSQQKHFLVQRDKRHLGNCGYVCVYISTCVCVCARTRYNQLGNAHHVGSPNIELGAEW